MPVTGPGSPLTITGLTNGQSYRVRVRARNSAGWGPYSAYSNPASPVAPTTFAEGFESGNLSAWSTPVISGTGTVAAATAAARTGTYGLRITKPLNDTSAYVRKTFPSVNSVHVEGWYRWLSDSGDVNTNGTGPRVFASTTRIFDVYRRDSNGEIWLRYQSTAATGGAGAKFENSGQTVALNTWVKLAVRTDYASGANSRIRVWVNDVLRLDLSGLTVWSGGYTAFQCGSEHTAQYLDMYIDDVLLNWAPV